MTKKVSIDIADARFAGGITVLQLALWLYMAGVAVWEHQTKTFLPLSVLILMNVMQLWLLRGEKQ